MSERACVVCGEDISQKRPQAKFCGGPCRAAKRRREAGKPGRGCPPDQACASCEGSMAGRKRGSLYCSDDCKGEARRLRALLRRQQADPLTNPAPADKSAPSRSERPLAAIYEPPLCRYERHRPSDWLSVQGIVTCGVCHPPARQAVIAARVNAIPDLSREAA